MHRFTNKFYPYRKYSNKQMSEIFAEPGYAKDMEKHMDFFGNDKWWFSDDHKVVAFKQINHTADMIVLPEVFCESLTMVLDKNDYLEWKDVKENWNELRKEVNNTLSQDRKFMKKYRTEMMSNIKNQQEEEQNAAKKPIIEKPQKKVIVDWT